MKVMNLTSDRSGREVANQFVITDGCKVVFQSYDSTIAVIDNSKDGADRITLGGCWDYSKTTMKYLCKFLKEFAGWSAANAHGIRVAINNHDIAYDSALC